MWSSSRLASLAAWVALLAGCAAGDPPAANAGCPERTAVLRTIDVFDGPPEQLATLVPDPAGDRAGGWELGYVYDAGRIVTLRCRYDDGRQVEVPLRQRVERCLYRLDAARALDVRCR